MMQRPISAEIRKGLIFGRRTPSLYLLTLRITILFILLKYHATPPPQSVNTPKANVCFYRSNKI